MSRTWKWVALLAVLSLVACADDVAPPGETPSDSHLDSGDPAPDAPSDSAPIGDLDEGEEGVSLPLEDEEYVYDPPPRAEREIPVPPAPDIPEDQEVELPSHGEVDEVLCCDTAFAFPHHPAILEVLLSGNDYPIEAGGVVMELDESEEKWQVTLCVPVTYEGSYGYIVTSEFDLGGETPEVFVTRMTNEAAPLENNIEGVVNWITHAAVETCDDLNPDAHNQVIPFDL